MEATPLIITIPKEQDHSRTQYIFIIFLIIFMILFLFGTTMLYIRPNQTVFILGIVLDSIAAAMFVSLFVYLVLTGCK